MNLLNEKQRITGEVNEDGTIGTSNIIIVIHCNLALEKMHKCSPVDCTYYLVISLSTSIVTELTTV